MKKKIKVHTAPAEYRIKYKINAAEFMEVNFYSVYHSSEAVDCLAHSYSRGHIVGEHITIVAVEEYNGYSRKWEDRTEKALEHSTEAVRTLLNNEQDGATT